MLLPHNSWQEQFRAFPQHLRIQLVSTKFLSDDECDNPMEDIEKDGYIAEARIRYGSNGAKEVDALLAANKALFAGGELSDDQKERFFQAITEAYFACREEAKKKYGRKKSDNQQ